MNMLDEIAGRTRERIQEEKRKQSLLDLKYRIREQERQAPSFYGALAAPGMSYICELKKASPSKGLIAPDFPYVEIAREYEAAGASAVLLICAILEKAQVREYRQIAEELGLDALVEAHDEREVEMALNAGARIVGVNNRDLRTFEVNMQNSIRLRNMAPRDVVFISESGIKGFEDIRVLYENEVDAVLIGETLMRSQDKGEALRQLNGGTLKQLRLAV